MRNAYQNTCGKIIPYNSIYFEYPLTLDEKSCRLFDIHTKGNNGSTVYVGVKDDYISIREFRGGVCISGIIKNVWGKIVKLEVHEDRGHYKIYFLVDTGNLYLMSSNGSDNGPPGWLFIGRTIPRNGILQEYTLYHYTNPGPNTHGSVNTFTYDNSYSSAILNESTLTVYGVHTSKKIVVDQRSTIVLIVDKYIISLDPIHIVVYTRKGLKEIHRIANVDAIVDIKSHHGRLVMSNKEGRICHELYGVIC